MWKIFPILGIFLVGCGNFLEKFSRSEEGSTQVIFSTANPAAALPGGLMIYIIADPSGLKRAVKFDNKELANGSSSIFLNNGQYRFYAVGFEGTGMLSAAKCAQAGSGNALSLFGGVQRITLNLTAADCAVSFFSNGDANATNGSTGFKYADVVSCQSGTNHTAYTNTTTCGTPKGDISHTRSFKIRLHGYQTTSANPASSDTNGTAIESACIRGTGKPGSNPVYTTTDTGGRGAFALSDTKMFFSLEGDGVVKNDTSSGTDSLSANAMVTLRKFTDPEPIWLRPLPPG
jgi:hypothetical protein